ncbi:MAG: hypothetical protein IPP17_04940 [Bacteroidetes bacterium]|nr:hypothetical protein [Bacteroidota bacterium]
MRYLVLYLAMFSMLAVSCRAPKVAAVVPTPSHSGAQTQPSVPSLPANRTKAEAIAAGLDFLNKSRWEWDIVYLYSYLQPKFGWADLPMQAQNKAMSDSLRRIGDPPALRILEQMELFQRLIDPAFRIERDRLQNAEEEDVFTLVALYCDVLKPDSATYFPVLRREMAAGDYRLTHGLLACNWLEEQGCFTVAELGTLKRELVQRNAELAKRIPEWIDLRIEAAALLAAAGATTPEEWVSTLIAAQQPDGGWQKDRYQSVSGAHPTILALWFLCEKD